MSNEALLNSLSIIDEIANCYPILDTIVINDISVKRLLNFNQVYELDRRLGKGAFGAVSLYREKSTNNLYAFKEIEITDETDIKMLQDEVTILSKLSKDNRSIVKYHDSFIYDTTVVKTEETYIYEANVLIYVIVTEYISGFTLQDYILTLIACNATAIPNTIFNIALWLFSTIAYIHDAGYVHRDIKPENIMIDNAQKRFVLLDFGLTCSVRLKTKKVAGTPEFIAPERWNIEKSSIMRSFFKGSNLSILKKLDIWSAGITIYCMVEKRLPWSARNLLELGKQIIGPYAINYTCDNEIIKEIMNSSINRDPNSRLSADEIVHKMKSMLTTAIHKEPSLELTATISSGSIENYQDYEEIAINNEMLCPNMPLMNDKAHALYTLKSKRGHSTPMKIKDKVNKRQNSVPDKITHKISDLDKITLHTRRSGNDGTPGSFALRATTPSRISTPPRTSTPPPSPKMIQSSRTDMFTNLLSKFK